jgi:Bifunctional DNA primase/polymerase, N-terminal
MLKETLFTLPSGWQLTPVREKVAYFWRWEKAGIDRNLIAAELDLSATGFGLLTGELSGGIIAIDCDGQLPHSLFRKMLKSDIPHTIAFTSGKEGRAQYLFSVPEQHWRTIRTRKRKAGKAAGDGMLEFRWNGCQSVLPPSVHPDTGRYLWINSPEDTRMIPLPEGIIEYLKPEPIELSPHTTRIFPIVEGSIPLERCLSRSHREVISCGVSEGGRHDMAVSLVRDLIGSANKLNSLGIIYDGDPQSLLWDFCARCSPPMPIKERDKIWLSHRSRAWAPSINDDRSFVRRIDYWRWENRALNLV